VPPILIATLLVTVFVVDAETAVLTSALPVASGIVTVNALAVAGATISTDPALAETNLTPMIVP
jgi:hypothetical protein